MDRREVGCGGNSAVSEEGLDAGAVDGFGQADDVNEPADGAVGERQGGKCESGNAGEKDVVAFGGGAAEGKNFVDAAELDAAKGAGDVGEPIVEADGWCRCGIGAATFHPSNERLLLGASALIAETAEMVGVGLGVGENGAAFAGGDLLVGIEAEYGEIAEAAGAVVLDFRPDGFGGVFNDGKVVVCGQIAKRRHVGGDAEGVDDQDGASARGEDALDGCRREVEGDGIDVGEDGYGADLKNSSGDGDESEGWNDDFVPFSDAESEQGHVQAGCAAADGDCVGDGVIGGECGLEGGQFGAEAEMRRAQNGGNSVDFGFGDVGRAERDLRSQACVPKFAS